MFNDKLSVIQKIGSSKTGEMSLRTKSKFIVTCNSSNSGSAPEIVMWVLVVIVIVDDIILFNRVK